MSNPFLHEPEASKKNFFGEIIEALVVALIFNIVVYFLFIIPSQVDGPSMLPNLHDKELLFANKMPTWFYGAEDTLKKIGWEYQRGDVVIFDFSNIVLVKRVIAVGGDKIKITAEGDVFVNGEQKFESFLIPNTKTYLPQKGQRTLEPGVEAVVPEGSFFVMGDNRSNSKDSRYSEVGFVERGHIKGVVFFRFFPFDKFGTISKPE